MSCVASLASLSVIYEAERCCRCLGRPFARRRESRAQLPCRATTEIKPSANRAPEKQVPRRRGRSVAAGLSDLREYAKVLRAYACVVRFFYISIHLGRLFTVVVDRSCVLADVRQNLCLNMARSEKDGEGGCDNDTESSLEKDTSGSSPWAFKVPPLKLQHGSAPVRAASPAKYPEHVRVSNAHRQSGGETNFNQTFESASGTR
jgi:hypothetical protein